MTPGKQMRLKNSGAGVNVKKKGRPRSVEEFNKERLGQFSADKLRQRPATSGSQGGLIRSEKAILQDEESLDSDDGDGVVSTLSGHKAQGVIIVDVHNENRESHLNSAACSPDNGASDEIETGRSGKTGSGRLFKSKSAGVREKNVFSESVIENAEGNGSRGKVGEGMAWEIEDSVDNFEDLEGLAKNLNNSNSEDSCSKSFGYGENFKAGRETGRMIDRTLIEEPKRRRKRWSKDERNLLLTEELIANSSDLNQTSAESSSRLSPSLRVRPVPAPRKKRYSKGSTPESNLAYDNAAFRSDPEEVLRIETEIYEPQETSDGNQKYKQSTKIEMTNFYESRKEEFVDSEEEFPSSWSGKVEGKGEELRALKISQLDEEETEIHKVGKAGDSRIPFIPTKSRKQSDDATSTFETSDISENYNQRSKSNRRKIMRKSERDSSSLNNSNSLTDISDLPRSESCEEERSWKISRRKSRRFKEEGNSTKDDPSQKRKLKNRKKLSVKSSEDDLIQCDEDKRENFISITIHKADVLETDFITRHPMVKVHIVEMNTGNYLASLQSDINDKCKYLQPMITRKFDFKENKSILPNWEEELIFEHNFDEIIRLGENQTLILFELLDLLNFAEASFNYNMLGNEGCWHKIAWAFLRPVGITGVVHINKKLRLQLYQPPKAYRKTGRSAICEVFNWWRSAHREKYPSTLYITLKAIEPPVEDPILYERLSLSEVPEIEDDYSERLKKSSEFLKLPNWKKLSAQSCKIPNNKLFESDTFGNGCFYVAFSNNGKYLACVGSEDDTHPIFVYSIPEGNLCIQFIGQKNFIYSLNWSFDDKYLLSVSSDQTACIWDMGKRIVEKIEMLPHPSYVYCGKFYPLSKHVVVTGCYDCVARVWTKSKHSKRYELTQELDEHKGFVSSLCFQKDGGLITADSVGTVTLWNLKRTSNASSAIREWRFFKVIKITEIENVVINTIVLHPLGSRLLIHSRDNGLRMIDLETGVILQRYKGLRNRRLQTTACISPCGGLVLCGGVDSYLTIWNLENGKRVARYLIGDSKVVACVAYHPFDHILAFSTFGSPSAVQVLNFDKTSTGENVGLDMLSGNEEFDNEEEIMMRFDKNDRGVDDILDFKLPINKGRPSRSLGLKYPVKKARSFVKIEETIDESSRSRREFLKLKIQKLNDPEEGLKSRSAARLNSIIEKIDKILVNTTLKRDLNSANSSADARAKDFSEASLKSDNKSSSIRNTEGRRSRSCGNKIRYENSIPSTDETIEFNSSRSGEYIEMRKMNSARKELSENEESISNSRRMRNPRAKSRANASPCNGEAESDEDCYRRTRKSRNRSSELPHGKSEDSKFDETLTTEAKMDLEKRRSRSSKKLYRKSEDCVIEFEESIKDSSPSTPDSFGTYTIDKNGLSAKPFPHNEIKPAYSSSSNSAKSSATFTIENEIVSTVRVPGKKRTKNS